MLVVVAPVILMTLAFAWWYRSGNLRAKRLPDFSYSGRIELVVWAIPAMVVLLLAGVTWIGAHQLDPRAPLESKTAPIRIQVVSLDWKWLFLYPDHRIAAVNQLVLPVGTPVEFELTSASVMNAFFVPQLGSQIYTMPGMSTHLNLQADHAGVFPGISSHFSGDGFSDMRFTVHAVSPAEFDAWVAHSGGEGMPVLDAPAYGTLSQASSNVAPATYGRVDPHLYEHILHLSAPMAGDAEEH